MPENVFISDKKYSGKIADAIMNGYLLEFKKLESNTYDSLQRNLNNGLKKSDIVYVELKDELVSSKRGPQTAESAIVGELNKHNDEYKSKVVVISIQGENPTAYTKIRGTLEKVPIGEASFKNDLASSSRGEESLNSSSLSNPNVPLHNQSVNNSSNAESSNAQILKQKIIDPELIKKLESEETIKVFRVMQLINGKLYPPMAEMVDGKRQEPTEMFSWYKADERPELAVPILNESKTDYKRNPDGSLKYYFNLVKTINGKKSSPMYALYNPYWHTSPSVLNDQFNAAYERPNLVVVEVEIPKSELEGIYKAEKAADPTGAKMWKSGTVSTKLAALGKGRREVILSRYNKIIRIVPNAEVASRIKEMLEGTDIAIPDNVVSPPLLEELIKQGVKIEETAVVKKYKAKLAASKEKESSTNILKQEKLTPEEKVAERIDNTYTFSEFAETDVENMIGMYMYQMRS